MSAFIWKISVYTGHHKLLKERKDEGDEDKSILCDNVGPCHGFIGHREFFPSNIHDRDLAKKLDADILFGDWCKRTPFHMLECCNCRAITLCDEGFPYQVRIDHGAIWARDEGRCFFAEHLLEWVIWDLWEKTIEKGAARY